MKLTKQELETMVAYDQNAAAWAESRNIKGYWKEEIGKFFNLLPSGKLLEVGSGGEEMRKSLLQKDMSILEQIYQKVF